MAAFWESTFFMAGLWESALFIAGFWESVLLGRLPGVGYLVSFLEEVSEAGSPPGSRPSAGGRRSYALYA